MLLVCVKAILYFQSRYWVIRNSSTRKAALVALEPLEYLEYDLQYRFCSFEIMLSCCCLAHLARIRKRFFSIRPIPKLKKIYIYKSEDILLLDRKRTKLATLHDWKTLYARIYIYIYTRMVFFKKKTNPVFFRFLNFSF